MSRFREIAKRVPLLRSIYMTLSHQYARHKLKSKTTEEVFIQIYKNHEWRSKDSVSGPGSDLDQTRVITKKLSWLFNDARFSTVLDIPCGDFFWMKFVDLTNIDYIGADIVNELIQSNIENFRKHGVRFQRMNLIEDKLPQVDLIFCRDCLVHCSFADIFLALNNLCKSQSKYLLTTTFTGKENSADIVTGFWHALNLERSPFNLPKPIETINEGCTQGGGAYKDKALGLWRIADIRRCLAERIS